MNFIVEIEMRDKLIVFITLGILILSPVIAANRTPISMQTWFLQSACEPKQTRYAKGYCEGAIEAYYSLMPNWCVPNDIPHGEVKRYVMSKIQQAPQSPSIRIPAEEFVWQIISKKYPCK